MEHLSIVILAAGKGKRMYSSLPKVLHPVGGKPMLQHVIGVAQQLYPQQVIVVYGHGGIQVRAACAEEENVLWVEQPAQLGTGHAVQQVLPVLPSCGKTLVLYGDVPLIQLETLCLLIGEAQQDVGLLTDVLDDPTGYGRIVREQNHIVAIVEEKDCSPAQKVIKEVNTGIMLLPNSHLKTWLGQLSNQNAQGEYYLTDVIAQATHDQISVHGLTTNNHWEVAGVNNKKQLAELERVFQRNQAEKLMEAGVMLADPSRLDIRGTIEHGCDVFIDVNVVLEGNVILGDEVSIGANCLLKDVSIGSGTTIEPFSHLVGATVDQSCKIGPFSRLRPGAELDQHVHVGNFVEIKNSIVGSFSKINHLSYIGDADIGQDCNIGAGTVTCNYDGLNKHRTSIEDKVFIGSGTMLVAPVSISSGATIGAGSVINKPAPANTLTVARARQVSIENWQRPQKKQDKT